MFCLFGCGPTEMEKRHDAAAEAAKIAAERPDRIKIMSRNTDIGNYVIAVIIQDSKTGQEFVVIRDSYGHAVAITPIKQNEER